MTIRKSIHLTLEDTSIHIIGKASRDYDLKSLSNAADFIVKQWEHDKKISETSINEDVVERIASRVVEMMKGV